MALECTRKGLDSLNPEPDTIILNRGDCCVGMPPDHVESRPDRVFGRDRGLVTGFIQDFCGAQHREIFRAMLAITEDPARTLRRFRSAWGTQMQA
jgi:hypothetical protein